MRYHVAADAGTTCFGDAGQLNLSKRFVRSLMKGKLTDHPLAELIREISSKRFSGTLRLEFQQAKTAAYFEQGQIIYAASNIRSLRLREYLKKRHVLPQTELAKLDGDLSDLALAATLRSRARLQQDHIDGLLLTLVADVLRVALLWTDGDWDFDERSRLAEATRVGIDTVNLLREAAQRLPIKFVMLRFRNPNETFSLVEGVQQTGNLQEAEVSMLSRLARPAKLNQLLDEGKLPAPDVHRVIYGLTLTGFVEREYWANAFRTGAKAPKEEGAAVIPEKTVAASVVPDSHWAISKDDSDLEKFFARLGQAKNHYEVIDLPSSASPNEIKDAYYALARRYHPDRFHLQSGTKLHAQISSAFARITQAYETLTDANARASYDSTLERSRHYAESLRTPKASVETPEGAEYLNLDPPSSEEKLGEAEFNFREGVGALQQDRLNAAITHLATASHLEPMEARYRAYYGRALGAGESTRRLAETELQAAVKLEPDNAVYRTMLAELYFDLKFHRRARTELDRALTIDPNNPSARLLLRKLEKSRKVG